MVVAGVDDEVDSTAGRDQRRPSVHAGPRRSPASRLVFICASRRRSGTARPTCRSSRARARTSPRTSAPGTLVVLESTTYPGTTEQLVVPILETSGLDAGTRLPARLLARADRPRQRRVPLPQHARAWSGGMTPESTGLAVLFYEQLVDKVMPCRSCRAAELAKLLENTFRHVNIALVNEMAMLCHEVGHRRLGGHRRRRDQAVRVHAVLPGPGRRRALHPPRPDLPGVAGAARRRAASSGSSRRPRTSTPRCRRAWPPASARR